MLVAVYVTALVVRSVIERRVDRRRNLRVVIVGSFENMMDDDDDEVGVEWISRSLGERGDMVGGGKGSPGGEEKN